MNAASTHRAKRTTRPKPEALPYPEIVPWETSRSLAWLSHAMRDEAALAELIALRHTPFVDRRCNQSDVLSMAIAGAQVDAETRLKESVVALRDAGGLLFLHPATTALRPSAMQACAQAFSAETFQ